MAVNVQQPILGLVWYYYLLNNYEEEIKKLNQMGKYLEILWIKFGDFDTALAFATLGLEDIYILEDRDLSYRIGQRVVLFSSRTST